MCTHLSCISCMVCPLSCSRKKTPIPPLPHPTPLISVAISSSKHQYLTLSPRFQYKVPQSQSHNKCDPVTSLLKSFILELKVKCGHSFKIWNISPTFIANSPLSIQFLYKSHNAINSYFLKTELHQLSMYTFIFQIVSVLKRVYVQHSIWHLLNVW